MAATGPTRSGSPVAGSGIGPPAHRRRRNVRQVDIKGYRGQVAALALTAALTACGGGSAHNYSSPRDLADALDCQNYNAESGAIAPADVATCRFDGEQVTLVVGDSPSQRDATIRFADEMARKFAPKTTAVPVVGGSWAVITESRSAAQDVQAKTGGEIRF